MLRNILHITDLHFKSKNNFDQKIVCESFFKSLESMSAENYAPDAIVFSGDIVWSADEDNIYYKLYDEFIDRLLKVTRCDEKRLVICPGNHDASRNSVASFRDRHSDLMSVVQDRQKLNSYAGTDECQDLVKERFGSYFDFRDGLSNGVGGQSVLSEVISIPEIELDFICINTAWLTNAGLKDVWQSDEGKLFFPEIELHNALERTCKEHKKVLVSHHPFSWLNSNNASDLRGAIDGRVDLHLYGHMHQPDPIQITSLQGNQCDVQGGAVFTDRDRYNGFSLVQVENEMPHIAVRLFSYFEQRRQFDVALDRATNGVFYNSSEAQRQIDRENRRLSEVMISNWAREGLLEAAKEKLNEALGDKNLDDVFVEPPITKRTVSTAAAGESERFESEQDNKVSLSDIGGSTQNFVIYGNQEFGRTSILRKLALDSVESTCTQDLFCQIPVLIDFGDIRAGSERVLRLLRANFLSEPEEFSVANLLEAGRVLILVDDVDFADGQRMKILCDFIDGHRNNRFILTTLMRQNATYGGDLIVDLELSVSFEHVFLHAFSRKNMRSLVRKWGMAGAEDGDVVINRIAREFSSMNIPVTALNGTILLTLYNDSSNFESPINRAELVNRFIEYLLEKQSIREAFRSSFDFKNKTHILSHLAQYMVTRDEYILDQSEVVGHFKDYIDEIGLSEDASEILDGFLSARILDLSQSKQVKFRYRFFIEYFIAQRMQDSHGFRSFVLEEENYLRFVNEIQYYAALTRTDGELLELISGRFETLVNDDEIVDVFRTDLNWFDKFKLPTRKSDHSVYEHLEAQIDSGPLTPDERDEILEAELPKNALGNQSVLRPEFDSVYQQWLACLALYSGVLKSSEIIPDGEKRFHMRAILNGWGSLTLHAFMAVPQIAEQRQIRINGVLYEVRVPKSMSEAEVAKFLYTELPNSVAKKIFDNFGSSKFSRQLTEPTLDEAQDPVIVQYFRNSLLVDLRLRSWVTSLEKFSKALPSNHCLKESLVKRSVNTYLLGDYSKKLALPLKKSLGEMMGDIKGHTKSQKSREKSNAIQSLDKRALLRRIHITASDDP